MTHTLTPAAEFLIAFLFILGGGLLLLDVHLHDAREKRAKEDREIEEAAHRAAMEQPNRGRLHADLRV